MKIKYNNTTLKYELIDDKYGSNDVLFSTNIKDGGIKEEAEFVFISEYLKLNDIKEYNDYALSYDDSDNISYVSIFNDDGKSLKRTIDKDEIDSILHENSLSLNMIRDLSLDDDGNFLVSYSSTVSESPEYDTFKPSTIQAIFKDMPLHEFKDNIVPYLRGSELDTMVHSIYSMEAKYPFMSIDDKSSEEINHVLDITFSKRSSALFKEIFLPSTETSRAIADKFIELDTSIVAYDGIYRPTGLKAFGIKDTLLPIDDYKALFMKSPLFKEALRELDNVSMPNSLNKENLIIQYKYLTEQEIEQNSYIIDAVLRQDNRQINIENALMNELGFKGLRSKDERNTIFRAKDKAWEYEADYNQKGTHIIEQRFFGAYDELKPLDEYIQDITNSPTFKILKDRVAINMDVDTIIDKSDLKKTVLEAISNKHMNKEALIYVSINPLLASGIDEGTHQNDSLYSKFITIYDDFDSVLSEIKNELAEELTDNEIRDVFLNSINTDDTRNRVVFQLVGDKNIYVTEYKDNYLESRNDLENIINIFGNESFKYKQIEADFNEPVSRKDAVPFIQKTVISYIDSLDVVGLQQMIKECEEDIKVLGSVDIKVLATREIELSYLELKLNSIEAVDTLDISLMHEGDCEIETDFHSTKEATSLKNLEEESQSIATSKEEHKNDVNDNSTSNSRIDIDELEEDTAINI